MKDFAAFPSQSDHSALLHIAHLDRDELDRLGRILDRRPVVLGGRTVAESLIAALLRVRTRQGRIEPLVPNPVQRAFERRRGRHNIVLKARQMGLTTWTAARFFLRTITQPGSLTLQVAHTQESAEAIFRIVHRFVRCLPASLRTGPLRTSQANVRLLTFPALDAQYMVATAGDRNVGRGLTLQNLHCSELARWPGDPGETLAGLRAALAPSGELVLESTPEGVGGCFHEEWQKAAETGLVRHFFPWWMEPSYRAEPVDESSLTTEERDLAARERLDLAQIGFRRRLRASFRGLARQEFAEDPETCFLLSGDSVFELAAIEARLASAPPPLQTRRNGELELWLPPVPGKHYLVSVDPAGGGSEGDYSAAQVVEMETGLQCAEFAAHLGGLELARFVCALAAEYNQAWLVIERNNHGSGILALAETACNYPRIFTQNAQPGWLTTSLSRPAILGRLNAALIDQPRRFMSRRLLAECRSFVRLANGSTGARPGTHDDRVLSMAIALAARAALLESGPL
ncbi:MAG TPA: terminase [Terracidiphilus sp.]|nr:terminase [Terracidiphilus sp.]